MNLWTDFSHIPRKNTKLLGLLSSAMVCCLLLGCTPAEQEPEGLVPLHVQSGQLVREDSSPIQLRGMSSHGIGWYPRYLNGGSMRSLKEWGANLVRLAMYTESTTGYITQPESNLDLLYMGIESALAEELYVIVDWHVLKDQNPLKYVEEAEVFFREIASHYRDHPGILYEICNEPNGDTSWEDIKDYADRILPIIRQYAPNAVVLVGTPNYASNLKPVISDPLEYENVLYSFHYYIDVSTEQQRDFTQLRQAVEAGLPVFVTEWGISYGEESAGALDPADESNICHLEPAQAFLDYLAQQQISWAGWSLSNKDEVHSALLPDCKKLSGWLPEDLTVSGKLMFENFSKE